MPGPESAPRAGRTPLSPASATSTAPPLGVNLMAFERRLVSTFSMASGSKAPRSASGVSAVRRMPLRSATGANAATTPRANGARSTGRGARRIAPASSFATSRIWFTSRRRRRALRSAMSSQRSTCGSPLARARRSSSGPMVSVSGVRSSWTRSRRSASSRDRAIAARRSARRARAPARAASPSARPRPAPAAPPAPADAPHETGTRGAAGRLTPQRTPSGRRPSPRAAAGRGARARFPARATRRRRRSPRRGTCIAAVEASCRRPYAGFPHRPNRRRTLEPIAEADVRGLEERERRVLDLHVALVGCERDRVAFGANDASRRPTTCSTTSGGARRSRRNRRRIDHDDAVLRREPEPPVPPLRPGRLHPAVPLAVAHAVTLRVRRGMHRRDAPLGERVQLRARDPEDPAVGVHPQPAGVVLEDLVDDLVEESVLRADADDGRRRPGGVALRADRAGRARALRCRPRATRRRPRSSERIRSLGSPSARVTRVNDPSR